jgi:hypothetical protein
MPVIFPMREQNISDLCRREGIAANLYYRFAARDLRIHEAGRPFNTQIRPPVGNPNIESHH